jgi:hypothetical protein
MTRNPIPFLAATAVLATAGLALPAGAAAAPRTHQHRTTTRHKARTFSFYAQVVRSSPAGLTVRLRTGKKAFFSAHQLAHKPGRPAHKRGAARHHRSARHGRFARVLAHAADTTAPPVSVNIVGLQPGVTVLITETVNPDGSVSITITLPPPSTTGEQTVSGVVGDVGNDSFDVQTSDGSDYVLHMAASTLAGLNLQSCDEVTVTYHQDSEVLIADTVQTTGSSTSGDCQATYDATGPITAVSGTSVTVTTDTGAMSFAVDDSSLTDGFVVGDVVDVTYVDNGDGTYTAQDVQYVQQDASGTVTAVGSSQLTVTDSSTGATDTFSGGPNSGVVLDGTGFDGIQVGDQVDVTYHVSNGHWVADQVNDNGPSGGDSSGASSSGDSSSSGD